MGQEPAFLLVHHLAEGLDQLLAFLADANQRDALNAFLKLPNRRDCIRTVADHCFPDGVWFELSVVSDDGPRCGYQFWLKWLWSDPDPSSDKLFDVTILPKSRMGPQPGDSQVMQACWEALQERSIRRLLDPFTRARLFLPEEFSETTVLGMLAQLVLLACRKGSLITRNDTGRGPASVFRDHVNRIAPGYFKDYQGKALAEAARYEIMDTVFKRLYLDAQPGQGFMAAAAATAFPAYIRKAIRGEIANYNQRSRAKGQCIESYEAEQHDSRRRRASTRSIPASAQEAAEQLGVSPATAWRKLKAAGGKAPSAKEWTLICDQTAGKKKWQYVKRELELRGRKPAAARQQVYRWRQQGLAPEQALRLVGGEGAANQVSSAAPPVCSACGDRAKLETWGKPYCMECFWELFGAPSEWKEE